MTACWSDERIDAAARETGEVEGHLAECAACRDRVSAARAEIALLAELRAAQRQPSPRSEGLVPGYRLESEIHRGGQGIVYRAVQEATKRRVALKVLLAGPDATGRERRRFEREIELASRLDHAGIVTLYDSGVSDRTPWCAMELVEGVRLDEWVSAARPDLRAKLALFRQIVSAVAHAHQRGVIHRDLKPANVLVDANAKPHVLDFGAALADASVAPVAHGDRLRMTAPGEFLGTLAYAAPEQFRGAAHAIDTRTDVYALGVVLYELVAGALPFESGGGMAELAEHVTTRTPPAPSTRAHGIDRDLDALVAKALATDPADRYGSAGAFDRDLERYLAGEPIEARRHSLVYVLQRHVVRRRRALVAASAVALAGGALAFAWLVEHQRAERQAEQAALVRSIVQDLLAAPSPQRMGGDARLLDVYEVLARDLDAALSDAPDVQAEVELTIGETYRRLLRSTEAEPHLRKALARFRQVDEASGLQVARAAIALSLALADTHDPEAVTLAREALAIRERALPAGHPDIAISRRTLAIAELCRFRDPDVESARELLDVALAELRALFGDDHAEVAETKVVRVQVGDDLSARASEELLSSALATFERSGSKDPRALDALTSYASFLQQHGRFEEARVLLDRAGSLAQTLFGDALAADMLRRHARLEFADGGFQSAELLSRQAVARELESWAARREDASDTLRALARRIEQPGTPAAEPPFAEAFAALRSMHGDGAFELAQWMNGIALTLRQLERGAATEPLLREALKIRCRAMGADCPVRRASIALLATELVDEKRGGEAIPLLEESLETFERVDESHMPDAERTRELLAQCRSQAQSSSGR